MENVTSEQLDNIPSKPKSKTAAVDELAQLLKGCKPGVFEMINKEVLLSDDAYQRYAVSQTHVANIRKNFSWAVFGTVAVARRPNGDHYVFDGQTRVTATVSIPDVTMIPCMVYDIPMEKLEALAFLQIQKNRKNVTALDQYRAQLVIRHPDAVFVDRQLRNFGIEMSGSGGPNKITCAALLMRWAGSMPNEFLRLWPMLADWSKETGLSGNLLAALMYIERRLPDGDSLSMPRWADRLNEIGPINLTRATRMVVATSRKGAGVWAVGILDVVNKRLKHKLVLRDDPAYRDDHDE